MSIQIRSESTGIKEFDSLDKAFTAAEMDDSVWKLSFEYQGERIRLTRNIMGWQYDPMQKYLDEALYEKDDSK